MAVEIDIDKFDKWVHRKFPTVRVRGDEYCVDSIFADDRKQHLWINPSKNAFHCWKTDRSGNVLSFVSRVEECEYNEAIDKVARDPRDVRGFHSSVESLKRKVEVLQREKQRRELLLPKGYMRFEDGHGETYQDCLDYLVKRNIDPRPYDIGYCESGEYKGGIVLPVFDPDGLLVYWTIRMTKKGSRYRNPPKDTFSLSKEDVIWSGKKWPDPESVVMLTEGIFDAITLRQCGFPSVSLLGKDLHDHQKILLKQMNYSIILSADNDKRGKEAMKRIYGKLLGAGIEVLGSVSPQEEKDWNETLVKRGKKYVRSYIPGAIQRLDISSRIKEMLSDV